MEMTGDHIHSEGFDLLFNHDRKQSFRVKRHLKNICLVFIITLLGRSASACTQKAILPPNLLNPFQKVCLQSLNVVLL